MALISGIHHVALKCVGEEQYKKTVDFYANVLQMPICRVWATGTMVDSGSGIIEIFNDGESELGQGAIRHFAFLVDDPDLCIETVRAAGYEVTMEPVDLVIESAPGLPIRVAFCIGPVGEEVEFFHLR